MKKRVITAILAGMMTFSLCACGSGSTGSTEATTGAAHQSSTAAANDQVNDTTSAETTAATADTQSGAAYVFSKDSQNRKVYDVKELSGTDLYKVQLNTGVPPYYVMDSQGNTVFQAKDEVKISDDHKYVYTALSEEITIYNAVTHENVTPDGVNDDFSSTFYFIEGDILFTGNAAYDLTTGACLWHGDAIGVQLVKYKANGLMLCRAADDSYVVYNYLTGKNLFEDIDGTYDVCQINSAGYFCIQTGETIQVYDSDGALVNEFAVPDGHVITDYVMPGEHFAFYEIKKSPYQVTVTDLTGQIVREDVYIREWSDTYDYYSENDTIMVHGDLTGNNRDWYSGILDSSMNWVVSQTDRVYDKVFWIYGDLYAAEDENGNDYLYNAATQASIDRGKEIYAAKYCPDDSQIIRIGQKMYRTDTFELIDIEYQEGYTYTQISETTFIEYDKTNMTSVTVYDVDGNTISTIELAEGSEYVAGLDNSMIVYSKDAGYELITIE